MSTFDIGFAGARTTLAWQRTALAIVAGAAIMVRLTLHELGRFALVTLGLAVLLSSWVLLESMTRHLRRNEGAEPQARGGRAGLALALAVVLIGVTEIATLTQGGA